MEKEEIKEKKPHYVTNSIRLCLMNIGARAGYGATINQIMLWFNTNRSNAPDAELVRQVSKEETKKSGGCFIGVEVGLG